MPRKSSDPIWRQGWDGAEEVRTRYRQHWNSCIGLGEHQRPFVFILYRCHIKNCWKMALKYVNQHFPIFKTFSHVLRTFKKQLSMFNCILVIAYTHPPAPSYPLSFLLWSRHSIQWIQIFYFQESITKIKIMLIVHAHLCDNRQDLVDRKDCKFYQSFKLQSCSIMNKFLFHLFYFCHKKDAQCQWNSSVPLWHCEGLYLSFIFSLVLKIHYVWHVGFGKFPWSLKGILCFKLPSVISRCSVVLH